MSFTAGGKNRGDVEVTYYPLASKSGLQIELETSVEKLYGDKIRSEIESAAKEAGVCDGKLVVVDDGALPYVLRARVEAAIRLAKENSDER